MRTWPSQPETHPAYSLREQVCAADVMSKGIATVGPEDTMHHAFNMMKRIQRKGIPVVDTDGSLMGMLKFRDVAKAGKTGKSQQLVKAWMRRQVGHSFLILRGPRALSRCLLLQVPTVSPGMPFNELEEFLIERSIGRVPVVDEQGRMLGLITRTDVLRQHNLYNEINRRVN